MTGQILIQNTTVYLEEETIENGFLFISGDKIASISKEPIPLPEGMKIKLIDGRGLIVLPGFIDTHIHGSNGADVMDATEEALETLSSSLPKEGTTSFLATTVTQSSEKIEKTLLNIAKFKTKTPNAELLGIHLEGPFINKAKKGAQRQEFIRNPDIELMKHWQQIAGGRIKTVTFAPECADSTFISYLKENRYTISAGHSMATFEEIKRASEYGVQQLTHLCNAMTGIHHRDIGAVGAAFLLKKLKAELIADEIHTNRDMLQIIYNNMTSDRLLLITDAIRAKSLKDGVYELGGQEVYVSDYRATLQDGTLAGSVLKMIDAAKNMLKLDGVTLRDIMKMTAINPAKQINIFDRKGSIAVNKDADILLVDKNLTIKYTICRGTIAYEE